MQTNILQKQIHRLHCSTTKTSPIFCNKRYVLKYTSSKNAHEQKQNYSKKTTIQQKKNYVKKWFNPPELMKTHWYFQQDLVNQPLILLHISACSLDQFYIPENQISTNITLWSLNTDFFRNNQFADYPPSRGYIPKTHGTKSYILYTEGNGGHTPTHFNQMIPLLNTTTYTDGVLTTSYQNYVKPQNWGNPFTQNHSHPDVPLYYNDTTVTSETFSTDQTFTPLHELYFQCRYNPERDQGLKNIVFFKSNKLREGEIDTLPKEDVVIRDFPLWLIFWSWISWIEKSKPIQHIWQDYMIIVKSPYIEPKRQSYLFLDRYFVFPKTDVLTERDKQNWYPKTEMQEEVIQSFAECGPGTPKIDRSQSIEGYFHYNFKMKWGGSPAPMELITDPSLQDKFPTPNNIYKTNEITNPATNKRTLLYDWDERYEMLTARAAKRIKTESLFDTSFTGTATDPALRPQTPETDSTSSEEESETPLQLQLQLLKRKNKQLRHKLLRITSR